MGLAHFAAFKKPPDRRSGGFEGIGLNSVEELFSMNFASLSKSLTSDDEIVGLVSSIQMTSLFLFLEIDHPSDSSFARRSRRVSPSCKKNFDNV